MHFVAGRITQLSAWSSPQQAMASTLHSHGGCAMLRLRPVHSTTPGLWPSLRSCPCPELETLNFCLCRRHPSKSQPESPQVQALTGMPGPAATSIKHGSIA